MQAYSPPKGRPFLFGLIFGLGLGVAQIVLEIVVVSSKASGGLFWLGAFVWLAIFFVVGILSAKRSGKVSTGTIAGLWAGTFGGLISLILNEVLIFIGLSFFSGQLQQSTANADVSTQQVTTAIVTVVTILFLFLWALAVGLGAGLGALGGLVGQATSTVPKMQYQQYPSYPQYPTSSSYPPDTQYPSSSYPPNTQYPQSQYPPDQYPQSQYPPQPPYLNQ